MPSTLAPDLQRLVEAQCDERIFVEISSASAGAIEATAASAIENATRSDRLRFGVYVRHDDAHRDAFDARRHDPRFSVEFGAATAPDNDQWARHRAQSFYDGEPYVLQIDGDARFVAGWDAAYIEVLANSDTDRPLLTDAPLPVRRLDRHETDQPITALEMLARHCFTIGRFCIDVPHDPEARGDDDIRLAVRGLHPRLRRFTSARSARDRPCRRSALRHHRSAGGHHRRCEHAPHPIGRPFRAGNEANRGCARGNARPLTALGCLPRPSHQVCYRRDFDHQEESHESDSTRRAHRARRVWREPRLRRRLQRRRSAQCSRDPCLCSLRRHTQCGADRRAARRRSPSDVQRRRRARTG